MLCESKSSYVCDFIIHTGSGTVFGLTRNDLLLCTKVVMTLMKPLLNKGYCLTVENYYTSTQLANILVKNHTDNKTVRLTRKNLPVGIKKEKQKRGKVFAYTKKIMVLKWKDKKDVLLFSRYTVLGWLM